MPEPDKKPCTICRKWKDLTEFYWRNKEKGTRQSVCISCTKRKGRNEPRGYEDRKHYLSARGKALTRLRKAFPDLYLELLEDELRKSNA